MTLRLLFYIIPSSTLSKEGKKTSKYADWKTATLRRE